MIWLLISKKKGSEISREGILEKTQKGDLRVRGGPISHARIPSEWKEKLNEKEDSEKGLHKKVKGKGLRYDRGRK